MNKAMADCHAEMHAERARLEAELEQARAELARGCRPWWWRWSFGIMELSAHSGHEDLPCFGLAQVHPR